MKRKINFEYLLLIILFYVFVFNNVICNYIPQFKLFDELFTLLAVPIFFFKSKGIIKKSPLVSATVIFLICGIIGNLYYYYQPIIYGISDLFVNLKFWLVLYIGLEYGKEIDLTKYQNKLIIHIEIISFLFFALTMLDFIFNIFTASIRNGIRSVQLFYYHPTYFAGACIFVLIVFFSVHIPKKKMWVPVLLLLMIISTLRSKAIAGAILIAIVYYLIYYRKKKVSIKTAFLFLPVGLLIGWKQISWYFFSDIKNDSARYLLLTTAFKIANACFPVGSGFGTFASHTSGEHYSPLYYEYGISNANGLREQNYSFVSDSFWPMIIGQNGWIGLLAFLCMIYYLYKRISSLKDTNTNYYCASLSAFLYIIVSSFAESAFVHPMMIPLSLWIGLMLGHSKKDVRSS